MPRIYLAGKYSADNIMDVLKNIRVGIHSAAGLMADGYNVFCPFLDFQLALTGLSARLKKEDFQRNSMAWVEVSDAVYVMPGWETSRGVKAEIERAEALDIPVFYDRVSLDTWRGSR